MNIDNKFQTALKYHQTGDLERAARLYREILQVQPLNIPALHLLGVIFYQFGDYDSAIEHIKKALRLNPNNPDAQNHLGSALKAKGLIEESITCYQKAIDLNPAVAEAHFNLGNTLVAEGRFDEAIVHYQKAVEIKPDFFAAYYNMAKALFDKGNYDEAVIFYQKALQFNPNSADIYDALGIIFQGKGESDKAIVYFKKAIELNQESPGAYGNLGKSLQEKGYLDEALTHYEKALKLNSDHTILSNLYNNMGVIYQEKGQFDEALVYYQKALELDRGQAGIYKNLGTVLHDTGFFDEAADNYRKALGLTPDDAETYCNLGSVLEDEGQFNEALKFYQKALQIDPTLAEAHWNLSLAQLKSGNLEEGWKGYEWRLLQKDARPSAFPQPQWDGRSLKGKRIMVSAEQGVGDEIMFASCLPDVIHQADSCIVECDKRLLPLFARSFPKASFIERHDLPLVNSTHISTPHDGVQEEADFQIRMGSLPKFLRRDFTDFPERQSYLVPDEQKVILWRQRYHILGQGLKIGVSWKGGSKLSVKFMRSTVLKQWTKLFSIPGIHFINIQYGDCSDELKKARENLGVIVHDWEDADPLKDLDNFAAQIAGLDLVISVDNSTVHMAGAIGVPVWALLPYACDWRWMTGFEDTPWYKSVRLFRQKEPGSWDEMLDQVSSDLDRYASTGAMAGIRCSYKSVLETKTTVHQSAAPSALLSSDRAYRCAVITPVGPGHEKLYDECLDSINRAFANNKGIFSEIVPISIDDTGGKLGRSKARNIAIRRAAEQDIEWLFFIDADDLMSPLAFEYVSLYLDKYDGVWGSIWPIEYGAQTAEERPGQLPFLYSIEDVLAGDPFVTLGIGHFVKTPVALSTPFDESLDAGEDFDYYLRVWEEYRCIKIPLPFWYHRRGSHSQGPRSATGCDWRQRVENIIKEKRQSADILLESKNQHNEVTKVRIEERIKRKYPAKHWERIEQERQKLITFCKPLSPLSLVRLGDGELRLLKKKGQLTNLLVDAIRHADLLGLPDHFDTSARSHIFNWDRELYECLRHIHGFLIDENRIVSSYIFLYAPEIIGEFLKGKRVLWITANSETIVNNLRNELFRSYYNLHDIARSGFIEIPESDGALPSVDYVEVLLYMKKCLSEQQDYDIALVGGGVLGKIYCHTIKTEYGKQAIDVGCMMSAYKGLRNRIAFRNGGDFDFLVWQQ
jgi:tetratricopeptide (TPR) repeat protein